MGCTRLHKIIEFLKIRQKAIKEYLVDLLIFCLTWVAFFHHPLLDNIIHALFLFVGSRMLTYCISKIYNRLKYKKKNNSKTRVSQSKSEGYD